MALPKVTVALWVSQRNKHGPAIVVENKPGPSISVVCSYIFWLSLLPLEWYIYNKFKAEQDLAGDGLLSIWKYLIIEYLILSSRLVSLFPHYYI